MTLIQSLRNARSDDAWRTFFEVYGPLVYAMARHAGLKELEAEEVLSTEPVPGSSAVRGSLVNILVNDGKPDPKVILPDLSDHAYLPVKMRLERLGLFVKETSIDEEFNALRSRVVLQRPAAGFVVTKGDTVLIVISARNEEERSL